MNHTTSDISLQRNRISPYLIKRFINHIQQFLSLGRKLGVGPIELETILVEEFHIRPGEIQSDQTLIIDHVQKPRHTEIIPEVVSALIGVIPDLLANCL